MFKVDVVWDEILRVKSKLRGGIQTHNLRPSPQKHRWLLTIHIFTYSEHYGRRE
jgi:hypothetical protein